MRHISRSLAFLLLGLSACATQSRTPIASKSWKNQCFAGFEEAVNELAGSRSIDCGFNSGNPGLACARTALKNGSPFRLGYGGIGIDSYICDVVVKNSDNRIVQLDYDSDVTGQMGMSGNHAAISVGYCNAIEIDRKFERGRLPFSATTCEQDKSLTDTVISLSQAHEH